ncbi:MAG: hypothetical protein ABS980_19035, partial [Rhodococcus sp. (in: high G+C Gram-positive bacteria)]
MVATVSIGVVVGRSPALGDVVAEVWGAVVDFDCDAEVGGEVLSTEFVEHAVNVSIPSNAAAMPKCRHIVNSDPCKYFRRISVPQVCCIGYVRENGLSTLRMVGTGQLLNFGARAWIRKSLSGWFVRVGTPHPFSRYPIEWVGATE